MPSPRRSEAGVPIVSIGMPVWNGENYVGAAIESILAQEFADFELIISDNASTDSTRDICSLYAKRDNRVHYSVLPKNLGASFNYNRVYKASRGQYFKWAAHDDLLRPFFLTRCVSAFQTFAKDAIIVYPKAEFIDEAGGIIEPDKDTQQTGSRYAAVRAFEVLQSMSMAASVFGLFDSRKLGRTNLIGNFISSDYALLLQSSIVGKIVQIEGEPLFQRRIHTQMSRHANVSKSDVLRWFDPNATSRLTEYQRLYIEYLKSPYLIEGLSMGQRNILAAAVACGILHKSSRVTAGRWRRQIVRSVLARADYWRAKLNERGST